MKKKLYCFNCNKDVEPICNLQNNNYIVHKQQVQIKEMVFTCPLCNNELFDENIEDYVKAIASGIIEHIEGK